MPTAATIYNLTPATRLSRYLSFCSRIDDIISKDPGSRGIQHLRVRNDLAAAGLSFARSNGVVVLTGFPCRVNSSPPTETDGPSGAAVLARGAVRLGKRACLVTDDSSEGVIDATWSSAASSLTKDTLNLFEGVYSFPGGRGPAPDTFPGLIYSKEKSASRIFELSNRFDHTIAIERAGRAIDGSFYTMRAIRMDELINPDIDDLMLIGTRCGARSKGIDESTSSSYSSSPVKRKSYPRTSTGIGDGGNESGMGKVITKVQDYIQNGKIIAAATSSDHLIASGVSNWGAWGLLAAVEGAIRYGIAANDVDGKDLPKDVLTTVEIASDILGVTLDQELSTRGITIINTTATPSINDTSSKTTNTMSFSTLPGEWLLPTENEEKNLVCAMNASGAADGITGERDGSVDGMPLSTHLKVLDQIRTLVHTEFNDK